MREACGVFGQCIDRSFGLLLRSLGRPGSKRFAAPKTEANAEDPAKHLDGEKAGDCCDPLTILARVASDASCRRNRRNNALDYDARRW